MEDRGYFLTIGLIFLLVIADATFRGGSEVLFLARKVLDLMDYVIFWR